MKIEINMQKSITFSYSINEQLEFDVTKTIPFTIAPKYKVFRNQSNKTFI